MLLTILYLFPGLRGNITASRRCYVLCKWSNRTCTAALMPDPDANLKAGRTRRLPMRMTSARSEGGCILRLAIVVSLL